MSNESRQQENSYAHQRESWRRAYAHACTVRERFPVLDRLTVEMVFRDEKRLGTYSSQVRTLAASAKAFFSFACPRTLCLNGGFDLDGIIETLIAGARAKTTGVVLCEGWLHPTHSGNSRCRLELDYSVQLLYQV